jgi:hypothetical protein
VNEGRRIIIALLALILIPAGAICALELHTARVTDDGEWVIQFGYDNECLYGMTRQSIKTTNVIFPTNGISITSTTNPSSVPNTLIITSVTNPVTNYMTNTFQLTNYPILAMAGAVAPAGVQAVQIPFIGVRWSPAHAFDLGIRNWGYGVYSDLFWQFKLSPDKFFGVTLGAGVGATWVPDAYSNNVLLRFAPSAQMDIRMFSMLGVYISVLWNVDYALGADSYNGIDFIPSAGFRLFDDDPFTIIGEIGLDKAYSGDVTANLRYGVSIRWRVH